MATYTKKFCPHCRHMYQSYSTGTKNMVVANGCPIITCPRCGKQFLDKDIKEPAFYDSPKEVTIPKMIISLLFTPFGLAGMFLLIMSIVYKSPVEALISLLPFSGYGYLLYVSIKNKKKINEDTIREYEESKDRLSDKEYVVLLLDLGYRVPRSFLRKNYPDLLKYKRKKNNKPWLPILIAVLVIAFIFLLYFQLK